MLLLEQLKYIITSLLLLLLTQRAVCLRILKSNRSKNIQSNTSPILQADQRSDSENSLRQDVVVSANQADQSVPRTATVTTQAVAQNVARTDQEKSSSVLQQKATVLAQRVREGVSRTDYEEVVSALQQLDNKRQLSVDRLVDPLTPLYELIGALNVAGREYFLVPELKLYITQVALHFAQRVYLLVCDKRRPVTKTTKARMLKQLDSTLSLLNPKKEPVTSVIHHLRCIRAIVDNLPDNTSVIETSTQVLVNLIRLALEKNMEAGVKVLQKLVVEGKRIYRGKIAEEITAVAVLSKTVLEHHDEQALLELIDLYKNTRFEETKYAALQALGRLARAHYGGSHAHAFSKEAAEQAYTAFNKLIEVAAAKNAKPSWYIQCAAVMELILLQNLLAPEYSQVVKRYLEDMEKTPKKNKSRKKSAQIQCILRQRDDVFRMGSIGRYIVEAPKDPTAIVLERIEQQQKIIMKHLGVVAPSQ